MKYIIVEMLVGGCYSQRFFKDDESFQRAGINPNHIHGVIVCGTEKERDRIAEELKISRKHSGAKELGAVTALTTQQILNLTSQNISTLKQADEHDAVNHPKHYTSHPSGVECIQVTEHMGFNLGNAVKYIWRADLKNNAAEDLKKAAFYINREIERLQNAKH